MSGASHAPRRLSSGTLAARLLVAALAALGALGACARPGAGPEGGPPDTKPPEIVRITPDSGRTGVRPNAVVFHFDEVVSERPSGAPTLGQLFVVSPRDGNVQVDWRRDAITVRPRRGWRANTTYTVTMLPGIADLRNNVRKTGASAIFSTGPVIPATRVAGTAFDWALGRPPAHGFAEAYAAGDTTLMWIAPVDSNGTFELRALPPGRFVVRAFNDENNNSALDAREPFDTAVVTLSDTVRLELLAFVHDTVGPRIEAVTPNDSVTLRVKFDRPLLPSVPVTTAAFVLRAADSSVVAITAAVPSAAYDSLRQLRTAALADSAARTSLDSARRIDPRYQARRDSASAARVDSLRRRAVGDSTRPAAAAAPPRMSRPSPVGEFMLTLATPLRPSALYRLQARATGLLKRERTSERSFRTAAPPKPDSTSTRPGAPRPAGRPPVSGTAPPGAASPAVRPDSARRPTPPAR